MKRIVLIICAVFLLCLQYAFGQITDTIIAIEEVRTTGARFDAYTIGSRIYTIDTSITLICSTENIGELLSRYSLVNVKSYGPSGLSSISLRGGSSRHTAIIWNGFNIRNPGSGSMNFSTLPAGFIDQISIQSGGSSTMYGSGASTGVIFLVNNLYTGQKDLKAKVNIELANFQTYSGSLVLAARTARFASRLKLAAVESENNITYKSQTFGRPVLKLDHAAFKRYAVSQQNIFLTGKKSKIETDVWFTTLFKDIPSLMSDTEAGTAIQNDDNFKSALTFSYYQENYTLKFRSGFFFDEVYYKDTIPLFIESSNTFYSFINEVESKVSLLKNQVLNIGINQTFDNASSSGYVSDTSQLRHSLYGRYSLSLHERRLNISLEARKEFLKLKAIPVVLSIGSQYQFTGRLFLKTNVSKHYSLPVFDDLFWAEDAFAAGNPNLLPENGWNFETGIKHINTGSELKFEHELTIFQNRIKDLIIWLPILNNGKYTPTNMNNSVSTGLEFSGRISKQIKQEKQQIKINYCFSYTDAKVASNNLADNWSQRIYVPKFKGSLSILTVLNKWNFSYNQTFESKRFYDDRNALEAYTLANFITGYRFLVKESEVKIYFKVKNIFNTDYQLLNGYPQPLRYYALGLNLKF